MRTTDTTVEDDISGIRQDIIERFRAMEDIRRIARETGQDIGVVKNILKPLLKKDFKDFAVGVTNSGPEGHA